MLSIRTEAPLLHHNTFGIQAKAAVMMTYSTTDDLCQAIQLMHTQYAGTPVLHIGSGSNLLFLGDFSGIILCSQIRGITLLEETADEVLVKVGAGETADDFIATAIRRGWFGMENLSLIPGQVGAAAVQNIGAYGAEACDFIHEVCGISLEDGSEHVWQRDDCGYAYRYSHFKGPWQGRYAITHVIFRLSRHFQPRLSYGGLQKAVEAASLVPEYLTATQLRQVIISIRQSKLPDPAVLGNAGSFFKNPVVSEEIAQSLLALHPDMPTYPAPDGSVKISAGWLIEQAGWKGKSLGPAAVHDRQALVLVNRGGASGHDILRLCEAVQDTVKNQFGIALSPEVNIV